MAKKAAETAASKVSVKGSKPMTDEQLTEERDKRLEPLTTSEDLQKDIQELHSLGSKIVSKVKEGNVKNILKNKLYTLQHNVNETKKIGKITYPQMVNFWDNSFYVLNQIIQFNNKYNS